MIAKPPLVPFDNVMLLTVTTLLDPTFLLSKVATKLWPIVSDPTNPDMLNLLQHYYFRHKFCQKLRMLKTLKHACYTAVVLV